MNWRFWRKTPTNDGDVQMPEDYTAARLADKHLHAGLVAVCDQYVADHPEPDPDEIKITLGDLQIQYWLICSDLKAKRTQARNAALDARVEKLREGIKKVDLEEEAFHREYGIGKYGPPPEGLNRPPQANAGDRPDRAHPGPVPRRALAPRPPHRGARGCKRSARHRAGPSAAATAATPRRPCRSGTT